MLSRETLDEYRRMTISERLALVIKMTDENTAALVDGRPEVVQRRFELLRMQNDEECRLVLEHLSRLEAVLSQPSM